MNALQTSIADWLHIVRGEFQEIPGLRLTKRQAQRMWGLDAVTCEALLDALVSIQFLKQGADGLYARVEVEH
jgi:hypothetical protein